VPGNRLVDHLAVHDCDTLRVLFKNVLRSADLLKRASEKPIDFSELFR